MEAGKPRARIQPTAADRSSPADALREACDRNLTAAFAALVPHTEAGNGEIRSFGAVVAVATGLPIAFYNPV